jgi:hypothetical protein
VYAKLLSEIMTNFGLPSRLRPRLQVTYVLRKRRALIVQRRPALALSPRVRDVSAESITAIEKVSRPVRVRCSSGA